MHVKKQNIWKQTRTFFTVSDLSTRSFREIFSEGSKEETQDGISFLRFPTLCDKKDSRHLRN